MSHRLLLIDDEPGLRSMLSLVLRLEGYSVVEAGDGREALTRLGEYRPDLILVDYQMPYLDGLEFIGRLRAEPAQGRIPVVLMGSPVAEEPNRRADAELPKPLQLDALLTIIEQLLAGRPVR